MSEARVHIDAQLQVRRDIEANWQAVDPVLRDGEIAYSKDVRRIKIGDGASTWAELNYLITDNVELGEIIERLLEQLAELQGFFYKTKDGQSIGTRFNLFTEQEFSAKGLSLGEGGGGSSDGGLIKSVLDTSYLGAALINRDDTVFNAYATNEIYNVTQANAVRISVLESQVGDLMAGGSTGTSAFLPITGGTIQGGTNVTPFVINSDSASQSNPQSGMRFTVGGVSKGWLGYNSFNGCHFYNYTTGQRIGIRDNGTPYFSPTDGEYKTLLHSGNYTDYTVGMDGTGAYGTWKISITGAVGGHEPAAFFLRYTRQDGAMDLNTLHQGKSVFCEIRTGEVTTTNCPFTGYGALLSMRDYSGASQTGFAKMQIAANSTSAWIRAQQGGNVAISSAWNQLAFVTSNVASATKLETARTLWGKSFNGTANIKGNIESDYFGLNDTANNPYLRLLHNNTNWYLQAYNGYMYMGPTSAKALRLDSEGRVTCQHDFIVNSGLYVHYHGSRAATLHVSEMSASYNYMHLYVTSNTSAADNTRALVLQNGYGNVGIGTADATEKLTVGGNILASGEISANVLNQGSDIRFKDRIEDVALSLDKITNAPVFRFRWNDRKDDRVYVGTSAQYWKEHIAELVSVNGEGFHKLDYSTLGVIIGVTLGKVVKNHEERISEIERRLKHECK